MKLWLKQFDFNAEKVCAMIFAGLTVLLTSALYQGNNPLGLSETIRTIFKYLMYILIAFNGYVVFNKIREDKKIKLINIFATLPIIVYFILTKVRVYSSNVVQLSNIYVVIWIIFCLSSDEIKIKTFEYFKKIFTVVCFIGVCCYIAYTLKLPIMYTVEKYYLENGSIYINYGLSFLQGSMSAPRLCCLFNEPGFLGTVCGFVLCADRLNLRKKSNLIIFLAGLLSFSMAFFLLLFVYMLLKSWKNIKYLIIIIIGMFMILVLPNIHTNIPIVDKTFERFQITNSGLAADNRTTEEFDKYYNEVLEENPLFGMGNGYFDQLNVKLILSYKVFVMDYGIYGCILIWGSLLASALLFRKYDYSILAYIIVFFVSMYQRPRVFNLQFVILLFGGIAYLSNQIELARLEKASRKKKKVIEFIHGLNTGGAETLVKEYALKLDKTKFDVIVLCLNHYKNSPYEKLLADNNIKVIYAADYTILKNRNDFISRKIKAFQRYITTSDIIAKEDPDIIHAHLQICKYIALTELPNDVKLFYSMHGEPERYKNMDKLDYYALKWLIKMYNVKIICLHDVMRIKVRQLFRTNNTIVLNNGIDFEKYDHVKDKSLVRKELNIPQDAFVIGHIGRFNKVKNHEFLVRVFTEVHKVNNKAFLLLIGDGEEKKNIVALLDQNELEDNYLILSNRDDIPDLLNVMDCFVFPSLSEGLGISVIEAQKAKLPCIVSDRIPNHAIISNLVKREKLEDEKKWVEYILKIRAPQNIQLFDEEWDIKVVVKKLENLFLEEVTK